MAGDGGGEGASGRVIPVAGFDGVLTTADLPFDAADRAAIAAHWASEIAAKPKLFDGRVLIALNARVEANRLVARHAEIGFSAFHWWRLRCEARGLSNVFGAAAVVTADGAVLMGRMGAHTAAAGMSYFPCGTPDLSDVVNGRVDLERSIARELQEETGLAAPLARPCAQAFAVFAPKVTAYVRRYETDLNAAELERRIAAHLAADPEPELDGVVFVRSVDALTASSPPYVRLVLPHLLGT